MASNHRRDRSRVPNRTTALPSSLRAELVKLGRISEPTADKTKRGNGSRLDTTELVSERVRKRRKRDRDDKGASAVSSPAVGGPMTAKAEAFQEPRETLKTSKTLTSVQQTPLEKLLAKQRNGSTTIRKSSNNQETVEDQEIAWLEAKLGVRSLTSSQQKGKWNAEMAEDGLDELFNELENIERITLLQNEEYVPILEDADVMGHSNAENPLTTKAEKRHLGLASQVQIPPLGNGSGVNINVTDPDAFLNGADNNHFNVFSDLRNMMKPPAGYDASICPAEKITDGKYVPPHMRDNTQKPTTISAIVPEFHGQSPVMQAKLKRQIMGQLNKLSPLNVPTIKKSLEQMYLNNPRAIVSEAVASSLLSIIFMRDALGEQLIITYAALVAILTRIIGKEFSTGIVADCVNKIVAVIEMAQSQVELEYSHDSVYGIGSKECENTVSFLAELYNFQVVGCQLLYDLIRLFLSGRLREFVVELLLKLVKRSGQRLRQDDPGALKEIVALVKKKTQTDGLVEMSSRTKFMVESLANLKNNKSREVTRSNSDSYSALKKIVNSTNIRSGSSAEPLRLSLSDIRSSSSKGKWWIPGAAWSGDPLATAVLVTKSADSGDNSATLSQLAQLQGMNTDVRKSIFNIIMGSEDYIEAYKNLLLLELGSVQEREIVRVLLQCCGNETDYNPYYTLIAQRMAEKSHSFQITLQYALWDFVRELGERNVGGEELVKNLKQGNMPPEVPFRRCRNLAKLYAWCVAKNALTLLIFKPMCFSGLQPQTEEFLLQFFSALFVSTQSASPALILPAKPIRRNRQALEQVFLATAPIEPLTKGLIGYLMASESALGSQANLGEADIAIIKFGTKVAMETMEMGEALSNLC